MKCEVSSQESLGPGPSSSDFTPETPNLTPAAANESCETNPIGPAAKEEQVLAGTEVRGNGLPNAPEETKPIEGGVSSLKCEVSSQESRGPSLSSSDFTPATSNSTRSAANEVYLSRTIPAPAAGGAWNAPDEEELRQTNPIGSEVREGQVLAGTGVRGDDVQNGPEKTKPIPGATGWTGG